MGVFSFLQGECLQPELLPHTPKTHQNPLRFHSLAPLFKHNRSELINQCQVGYGLGEFSIAIIVPRGIVKNLFRQDHCIFNYLIASMPWYSEWFPNIWKHLIPSTTNLVWKSKQNVKQTRRKQVGWGVRVKLLYMKWWLLILVCISYFQW